MGNRRSACPREGQVRSAKKPSLRARRLTVVCVCIAHSDSSSQPHRCSRALKRPLLRTRLSCIQGGA